MVRRAGVLALGLAFNLAAASAVHAAMTLRLKPRRVRVAVAPI